MTGYATRKAQVVAQLAAAGGAARPGLAKATSNLFRDRAERPRPRIDLSGFAGVVAVDPAAGTVDAEGMTTFAALADATLACGTVPQVVPQLKSITLGGALAGVGIEASSFRYGLVHETVTSVDVLTGDGRVLTCTPDNAHRDLFHGLPNSYGTLGYALRVTARTAPARRFVRLEHRRYGDASACFAALEAALADPTLDYLDGVVFARDLHVLTLGRFVDEAPAASDYTFERIYYRSLLERDSDVLTARDYLWRWDTDWFWCSKNVGAQHPWLRRLLGRERLNSVTYQKIMRWNARWKASTAFDRLRGVHAEAVIQDVDIPLPRAAEFLAFLHDEIGILPIWLCPIRAATTVAYPLYPLAPGVPHVNFGFWDTVRSRESRPPGDRVRRIERTARALGGLKSLYSDSFYAEDEFWAIYNRAAYAELKRRYDPAGVLGDLYDKCVRRRG
ncbi:MAG: FAD-binding oxidoreductase [Burkholderiales bacterium]